MDRNRKLNEKKKEKPLKDFTQSGFNHPQFVNITLKNGHIDIKYNTTCEVIKTKKVTYSNTNNRTSKLLNKTKTRGWFLYYNIGIRLCNN